MKPGIQILCTAVLLIASACNSNHDAKEQLNHKTIEAVKPLKKFGDIQFASKIDTTCGMLVSAGVEDTLMLNGKIYGFCAKECKDEFAKILKSQHKR